METFKEIQETTTKLDNYNKIIQFCKELLNLSNTKVNNESLADIYLISTNDQLPGIEIILKDDFKWQVLLFIQTIAKKRQDIAIRKLNELLK